jgi:hypothetical protein
MNWEVPEPGSCAEPGETLRDAYEREVRALAREVDRLHAEGSTKEVIARSVHAARRAIAVRYKNATPEPLRSRIIARTIAVYGNASGPEIDDLRRQGKSWDAIIGGALRPGSLPTTE